MDILVVIIIVCIVFFLLIAVLALYFFCIQIFIIKRTSAIKSPYPVVFLPQHNQDSSDTYGAILALYSHAINNKVTPFDEESYTMENANQDKPTLTSKLRLGLLNISSINFKGFVALGSPKPTTKSEEQINEFVKTTTNKKLYQGRKKSPAKGKRNNDLATSNSQVEAEGNTDNILQLEGINKEYSVEESDCLDKSVVLIEKRRKYRHSMKEKLRVEGKVDSVLLNSGPTDDEVPKGYLKASSPPPDLEPTSLLYKRCMYLWKGDQKVYGWYLGTIISTSRLDGFNYCIKYDRYETENVFVDGVKHVMLSNEGEEAYGRRWVLLVQDPHNKPLFNKTDHRYSVSSVPNFQ